MSRDDHVLRSIQAIHDSVLAPDGWTRALESAADAADGEHACLMIRTSSGRSVVASHRMTPDQMAGLARMEHTGDPHWRRVSRIPQGAAVLGSQFISDRDFKRSNFYNEAIRPIGAFHGLVAKLMKTNEIEATLSIGRRLGRDDFGRDDMRVTRTVLPHLASALKTRIQLAEAQSQVRAASHALDAMNVAAILVDAQGGIVFANGLAEAILSRDDSLTTDGIHIGGAGTPALRQLQRAIAQCGAGAAPGAPVAPVEIAAADGAAALRVTFTPLRREAIEPHDSHLGLAEPVALLLVHDRAQQRDAMRARLCARFALTAAEASVVMEVIAGGGRSDVAVRLGVSVATVRTHLIHIFEKTGVRRQAELVRLALDGDDVR